MHKKRPKGRRWGIIHDQGKSYRKLNGIVRNSPRLRKLRPSTNREDNKEFKGTSKEKISLKGSQAFLPSDGFVNEAMDENPVQSTIHESIGGTRARKSLKSIYMVGCGT
jgi:hypothetical protein